MEKISNPFIGNVISAVNNDGKASEVLNDLVPFTKIYHDSPVNLNDLTKSESQIFYYIAMNLGRNTDIIVFSQDDLQRLFNYKDKKSIIRAVKGLVDKGVIARTISKIEFYINPRILFNGNRSCLVNKYLKVKGNGKFGI